MKRTLLGMAALMVVIALGSAGVFVAHKMLSPGTPEETTSEPTAFVAARDAAPVPIPISRHSEDMPVARSPFGEARPVRTTSGIDDRYADSQAAEEPAARYESQPLDASDEIPSADQVGAGRIRSARPIPRAAAMEDSEEVAPRRGPSPFGRAKSTQQARYEEPADAADVATEEPAEVVSEGPSFSPAEEPQPLTPVEPKPQVDRYGRLAGDPSASRYQEQPIVDKSQPAAQDASDSITTRGDARLDDAGDEGTGRPGDPQLMGAQAPTLAIEKTAPPEIQIGKPARFVIKVRNTGSATAQGVEIHDTIPQGTQLIDATPQAQRGAGGALVWDLGALKPGEEQTIELNLMPTAEGEIGSVATVHFRAEASVRTLATKPMLTMDVRAPSKVMKGEEVLLHIKLSNPGTGAATGIVLSENVPAGLSHPSGVELELEVGTLKPGESRELELGLVAAEPGVVTNVVSAVGEGSLQVEASSEIDIVAPQLQVALSGPKRRFLERNAKHNISVSNPGTAAAKDIELVAVLPKELKFVEANNGGQFDAATHSVYWSLEELPPQESGTVTLTTLPLQPGDAKLLIKSKAQQGLADQREEIVAIEGLAAINFEVSDTSDPIEAGGQTSYEVRVTNQGSKAATNIRLVALLPREMKAISAEGPVRYKIEGQRIVFEALKQLAPKADTSFSVKVQALEPGDLRLQVQVSTDEIREPISKEEGTRVYGDE